MESDRPTYSSRENKPLDQFSFDDSDTEKLPECNTILWFGIISVVVPGLIGIILGGLALTKANAAKNLYFDYPDRYTPQSISAVKWGKGLSIFGFAYRVLLILLLLFVLIADL